MDQVLICFGIVLQSSWDTWEEPDCLGACGEGEELRCPEESDRPKNGNVCEHWPAAEWEEIMDGLIFCVGTLESVVKPDK
ncbi:NADH-quinone oxidoreductase subunit C/D, partial [Dissostichus eleginoides]